MALRAKLKAMEMQMAEQEARKTTGNNSRQELAKCEQNCREYQRQLEDAEAARLEAEVGRTGLYTDPYVVVYPRLLMKSSLLGEAG